MNFGLTNSNDVRQKWLKGYFAGPIVEANLKLVEHTRAAEEVETNSQALRKTNRNGNLKCSDLDGNVVNESRNVAPVANDDHLTFCRFAS